MSKTLHPQILAIHGGKEQTQYRERNQALFLISSFMFEGAQQGTALFIKEIEGFTYTRTANPVIVALEQHIPALKDAERSVVASTDMSVIQVSFFTFLKTGDHVVSSRNLFGTTVGFINNIMTKFGIEVSYVSQTDLSEWRIAVKEDTKPLFLETPSGPLNEMANLGALSKIAHAVDALLVMGSSSLSPVGQQPLKHGADISVQSAAKTIDGHGRVMGGVLSGSERLTTQVAMYCNSYDLAMSPFNAWILLSDMKTLSARMEKQFVDASKITRWLSEQPQVKTVYCSGLPGHPQAALAVRQQPGGGIVVSFEIGGKDAAQSLLDKVELFSKTANLGDVRPTITHPWTTIHGRVSPEDKQAADIRPGLLRFAIDSEYLDDLIADLRQAMA